MWLHVDAAYGGFAALTARGQEALRGIERADSIALDPHKWLYQPIECGALLVRQGAQLRRAFEIVPDYLKDAEVAEGEVNFSDLGLQLTRGWRALKIWLSIQTLGLDAFRAAIDRSLDLALLAERRIRETPELELLSPAAARDRVLPAPRRRGPQRRAWWPSWRRRARRSCPRRGCTASTRSGSACSTTRLARRTSSGCSTGSPARRCRRRRGRASSARSRCPTCTRSARSRRGRSAPCRCSPSSPRRRRSGSPATRASCVVAPGEAVVRRHQLERDFYVIVDGARERRHRRRARPRRSRPATSSASSPRSTGARATATRGRPT